MVVDTFFFLPHSSQVLKILTLFLGMVNTAINFEDTHDPWGLNNCSDNYSKYSRDPQRTPMQWNDSAFSGPYSLKLLLTSQQTPMRFRFIRRWFLSAHFLNLLLVFFFFFFLLLGLQHSSFMTSFCFIFGNRDGLF